MAHSVRQSIASNHFNQSGRKNVSGHADRVELHGVAISMSVCCSQSASASAGHAQQYAADGCILHIACDHEVTIRERHIEVLRARHVQHLQELGISAPLRELRGSDPELLDSRD
jgi:hypothetical protein